MTRVTNLLITRASLATEVVKPGDKVEFNLKCGEESGIVSGKVITIDGDEDDLTLQFKERKNMVSLKLKPADNVKIQSNIVRGSEVTKIPSNIISIEKLLPGQFTNVSVELKIGIIDFSVHRPHSILEDSTVEVYSGIIETDIPGISPTKLFLYGELYATPDHPVLAIYLTELDAFASPRKIEKRIPLAGYDATKSEAAAKVIEFSGNGIAPFKLIARSSIDADDWIKAFGIAKNPAQWQNPAVEWWNRSVEIASSSLERSISRAQMKQDEFLMTLHTARQQREIFHDEDTDIEPKQEEHKGRLPDKEFQKLKLKHTARKAAAAETGASGSMSTRDQKSARLEALRRTNSNLEPLA